MYKVELYWSTEVSREGCVTEKDSGRCRPELYDTLEKAIERAKEYGYESPSRENTIYRVVMRDWAIVLDKSGKQVWPDVK